MIKRKDAGKIGIFLQYDYDCVKFIPEGMLANSTVK